MIFTHHYTTSLSITPENPVPRVAPSDETPPPQTTPEQNNETTIPNAESTMQSAASNDVNNDENEIEMLTMSNKIVSI